MNHEDVLFPYDEIRESQNTLIRDINDAIKSEKNILVNAPTGLGKTIAALGPALKEANEENKTVFFLTSRHTQHALAIKTLRDIKEKFNVNVDCCDIIGKKWMCAQRKVEKMTSGEFSEYCKGLREDGLCDYYLNTKDKGNISGRGLKVLNNLKEDMPVDTDRINTLSRKEKLCPYEIAAMTAKDAKVIISDYNYIFNEKIRNAFFKRSGKTLGEAILIIDEGHNLPSRLREEMSMKISSYIISMAITEAKKYGYHEVLDYLKGIMNILESLSNELTYENNEDFVLKGEFAKKIKDYDEVMQKLSNVGELVREEQRNSFIGSVASFLELWRGEDRGFSRIISIKEHKGKKLITLSYRCLDPSFISRDVINSSASCVIMSGTLSPVEMYADLLGVRQYSVGEYKSPFSEKNRLNMIIEEVTTKFTARSEKMYRVIAKILSDVVNNVPGNSIVFFPSYSVRDSVLKYFEKTSAKKIFNERPGMKKEEKDGFLERFKAEKEKGGVLLGVAQGSFGEGVDLPGDFLKCVVVVGIPLTKPDLETRELIEYYDDKYGEGINYGYIYPAITKTLQNAGRCIRSEKDRGVIVFMDARYAWENYEKCFPKGWDIKVTKMWEKRVRDFFS